MTSQETFKSSVNIRYDIGEQSFLNNYLPTPSHADSIIGLTKGFLQESTNASHIMIGPYGSGKSLLATLIANIVGKKVDQQHIIDLTNKFNKVHQGVYESLISINQLNKTFIPITLNGSYKDFGDNVIETIQKELLANNINIFLPTERNNIIATIENWRKNYPSTFVQFKNAVNKKYSNCDMWISLIENGNREEIDWFKTIYTDLTSGAKFNSNNAGDFQENLNIILNVLKKENIGLLIIHDEFGRLLQSLEQSNIYNTMQELQDIAEFVNRSDGYLQLILISHKNMSQYMQGFNEEHKSEFQRVEKRYSSYIVESDSATYYRIVEQFMLNNSKNLNNEIEIDQQFLNTLKGYNLFPELNQHEVENLVINGSKPIHPVTLFLLPRISKVFGQNERTLFTYLESDDTHGFKKSAEKTSGFIFADAIFPYFFSENKLNNIYDENTESIIKTYQLIRSNLDARKVNAYRIIQFITLWEVTNSNSICLLTSDLISFATGIAPQQLSTLLDKLSSYKFVRYNRVQNKWELAEGSSVVVEDLIEKKKSKTVINTDWRMKELEHIFPKKYYLARDYNDVKNITRFMRTKFINSTKFVNQDSIEKDIKTDNADGIIIYVILDEISHYSKVRSKINDSSNKQIIYSVLKNKFDITREKIDNYIIINELQEDTSLLRDYKNLKSELEIYKADYSYDIQRFLNSLYEFKDNVEWFYNGRTLLINNEIDLEEIVSEIMWELYPKTPIIMNDSINRFKVVGIQKRSILKVIDKVLFSYHEDNIGIEGQGPDYLIYATIMKNNNIDLLSLDSTQNKHFGALRSDLLSYINNVKNGSLKNLYDIANSPPYGIRPPLIPLFIVISLRDKWNQLMFYRNNMFVPALEGEKIQEMFNEASSYEYTFQDYSEEVQSLLNSLEYNFKNYISEYVIDETQLIKVSSGLLNWLRDLPKQTQITNNYLSDEALTFKEQIRKSEVNPIASIEEINRIFAGDIDNILTVVDELKKSHLRFTQIVENTLCESLEINSFAEKDSYLSNLESSKANNQLVITLQNSRNLNDFAFNFIGTEIKNWSDVNFNLFKNQINNEINKIESDTIEDENSFQLIVNDKHKLIKKVDLSKKSELVYSNIERILKNAGRNVPTEEINFIILKLMNEHIE